MAFVHLHTHSEYSLLDGANRIPELVAHVKKLGMDSLAVTDHGNMHAAWSFYEEAKAQKIRPILGFEAYLAYGPRQAREKPSWAPAAYSHLVLLAKNRTGYKNLVRLTSMAKVKVTETAKMLALEGVQLMGGYGYATEYEMERHLRDAISPTIYAGTNEIQREIISSTYGLR